MAPTDKPLPAAPRLLPARYRDEDMPSAAGLVAADLVDAGPVALLICAWVLYFLVRR